MFRRISNHIHKRHKTLEEKLELPDAIQMIKDISADRLKKIKFKASLFVILNYSLKKPTPNKVASHLKNHFYNTDLKIQEGDYISIKHEVFNDRLDRLGKEKHYVDIIHGNKRNVGPTFTGNIKYLLKPLYS
jgi:hypothetical protein